MRRLPFISALLIATVATRSGAQASTPVSSPGDSIFQHAKRLVSAGNGVAGRALVDTMLKRATEGTPAYGDALYWRGALSETAAQAERDYRRVIVEYPLSVYADDALLGIAGLEQARGDRANALAHMLRYVHDHPAGPARGAAAVAAARLAFEQRDMKTGCAMITEARASTPTTDIEARNQVDYLGGRCGSSALPADSATAAPPVAPSTVPVRDSAPASRATRKAVTEPRPKPVTPTPAPNPPTRTASGAPAASPVTAAVTRPVGEGHFTIQVAAYNTVAGAEQLVAELTKKGLEARILGTDKPFRVRLGFYPTREAAQAEIASLLKQHGIKGLLTTEDLPPQEKKP